MADRINDKPLDHYLALPYRFDVIPGDFSWFIEYPDLPGCMTQVEDPADIGPMAQEIRELWIETAYDLGMAIPEPSDVIEYSGKFVVRIPKQLHRDLAQGAEIQGVSLNAYVGYLLAERHIAQRMTQRLDQIESTVQRIDAGYKVTSIAAPRSRPGLYKVQAA